MSGFAGTGALVRLAARRDRVSVLASIVALAVLVAGSARATFDLYPDAGAALADLSDVLTNPALLAIYGPLSDPRSLDALATFKTVLLGAVLLCILAYAVVRRHTRTEEEEGRLELLGAGVVGRRAPLAAAVLLGTAAVLLTALVTAVAAVRVGLDPRGSVALGVSWVLVGLTWVGVAAVAAQLTSTSRGAAGFALGALGLAYLVRAVGDTAPEGSALGLLVWLSPLGWGEQVAPYGANRLWLAALGVALYAALVLLAFRLLERRDLGSGILGSRAGPARGDLGTSADLARRLARGTVIGWVVGFAIAGVVVGSLAASVESFAQSPQMVDLLRRMGGIGGALVDTYFATELGFTAVVAAALGVTLAVRLRSEEVGSRAEVVLASGATRVRWAAGHVLVAAAGTVLVMAVLGVAMGVVRGVQVGDVPRTVGTLLAAALLQLPAIWVCIGVVTALFGLAPRWTALAWAVLLLFFALGELGSLLGIPEAVRNASPFVHVPRLGQPVEALPLVVLALVAGLLVAVGLLAFRRRDLA
ncbi:MAG TPA: polyketide antibiotic transporter [Intrasporangium sp.]|uniref:ABC transporter permease n=1 Tax=Intrasporangium sp. TaxID=1925024 RepID=UPI002D782EC5|nr:polyketide antibiotic transporter [Intrasporangium sp.]HET7399818.1 polyketide antibiotic transporter [Intrasporangium sp.]